LASIEEIFGLSSGTSVFSHATRMAHRQAVVAHGASTNLHLKSSPPLTPCVDASSSLAGSGANFPLDFADHYAFKALYDAQDFGQGVHIGIQQFESFTPSDIAATVRDLAAKDAIREVVYRYSHGIDRRDYKVLNDVFWPDSRLEYGLYNDSGAGFAAAAGAGAGFAAAGAGAGGGAALPAVGAGAGAVGDMAAGATVQARILEAQPGIFVNQLGERADLSVTLKTMKRAYSVKQFPCLQGIGWQCVACLAQ
jgi:hypothetical protein